MENKAVAKARVEGIDKDPRLHDDFQGDLKKWAVYKCAYYLCYTCNKPYFGGMVDCQQQLGLEESTKKEDLRC